MLDVIKLSVVARSYWSYKFQKKMLLDNLKVYKSQHYKLFYEHKEKRGI
jgi:hypothetical protein